MCRRSGCISPTRRTISGRRPRKNWQRSACRRPSGPLPGPAARGWRAIFSTIPRRCAASACSISPPAPVWSASRPLRPARATCSPPTSTRSARAAIAPQCRSQWRRDRVSARDDLIGTDGGWDVVLAGDVFYDKAFRRAARSPGSRRLRARGADVLVGDPGRSYLPKDAAAGARRSTRCRSPARWRTPRSSAPPSGASLDGALGRRSYPRRTRRSRHGFCRHELSRRHHRRGRRLAVRRGLVQRAVASPGSRPTRIDPATVKMSAGVRS